VEMALFLWGALNGTGADTDYAHSPAIKAGGIAVPATAVFGGVLPVSEQGVPRKVFSSYFEEMAPVLVESLPAGFADKLAARAAKAGVHRGSTMSLIDFVKGVTYATAANGSTRQGAKDALLRRRGKDVGKGAATPVEIGGPRIGGDAPLHSLY